MKIIDKCVSRNMRSRRKKGFSKPIEIPPYFPHSRYESTTEDPVIDNDNQKILLPREMEKTRNEENFIKHVSKRSVKDVLVNQAISAVKLAETPTGKYYDLNPAVFLAGPAGGILLPFAIYFYKLFMKNCTKKKQRNRKELENTDTEDSEEDDNKESIRNNITAAIGDRISYAGSSVVNHIRGKFATTGHPFVEDLRAQATPDEEGILNKIKTIILEQEEIMVLDIEEKFDISRNHLMNEIRNKFLLQKENLNCEIKMSKDEITLSEFQKKRREEEALVKLSDSEDDLTSTVIHRISNAEDALISEIEKRIEKTNENIFNIVETSIPEAKGQVWNRMKYEIKNRNTSLLHEIKSMLTCTENEIIDDIKSRMEGTKTDNVQNVAKDDVTVNIEHSDLSKPAQNETIHVVIHAAETHGAITVDIVQPELSQHCEETERNELQDKGMERKDKVDVEIELRESEVNKLSEISGKPATHGKNLIETKTQSVWKNCDPINTKQNKKKRENTTQDSNRKLSDIGEMMQRSSPIPIPSEDRAELHRFYGEEGSSNENSSGTSPDKETRDGEPLQFPQESKNSVPYLPFDMHFSGIPRKEFTTIKPRIEDIEQCEVEDTRRTFHWSKPSSGENEKEDMEKETFGRMPSKRWTVLEYNDEVEKGEGSRIDPCPRRGWLQWVEEDVNISWPKHLPDNLTRNPDENQMRGSKKIKHLRRKRADPLKKYHSKQISIEDDRKVSTVSTISEFSTTSSVDSTSSSTLESSDSKRSYLHGKEQRNEYTKRKSSDSGTHHHEETSGSEFARTVSKGRVQQKNGGGTIGVKEADASLWNENDVNSEQGSYYEGRIFSLRHQKNISSDNPNGSIL